MKKKRLKYNVGLPYQLYVLYCIRTGRVFYIGCSRLDLRQRKWQHSYESKKEIGNNQLKNELIRSLNFRFGIKCFAEIDSNERMYSAKAELERIKYCVKNGFLISNKQASVSKSRNCHHYFAGIAIENWDWNKCINQKDLIKVFSSFKIPKQYQPC